MNKKIKEKFDMIAQKYDSQRQHLIPCFDDFYNITTEFLEFSKENPNILDLGAGTGLLTYYIFQKYNKANYTLIDLSEEMLNIAKERFALVTNLEYIVDDYINYNYTKQYDAIVSALSIHHLNDSEKQNVYDKAYSILKEGGVFINADQVLGASAELEDINHKSWINGIEESPLTKAEKESAYNRMALDKMSTLKENIKMLENSGFKTIDVVYKNYTFAIIYARK